MFHQVHVACFQFLLHVRDYVDHLPVVLRPRYPTDDPLFSHETEKKKHRGQKDVNTSIKSIPKDVRLTILANIPPLKT